MGMGGVSVPQGRIASNTEVVASAKGLAMRLNDYLRRQAELCTAISRATFDLTMAGRLREMAAGFQDKAAELEDEMALPAHMIAGERASEGRRERD
jgi:hypothetical protein